MTTLNFRRGWCIAGVSLLAFTGISQAGWIAYNDCIGTSPGNVTYYASNTIGGGGGFETPSGLLKRYSDGTFTAVTATLTSSNISGSTGSMPNAGTPAHNAFNGILNLAGSASYNSSGSAWYYQVTFSGLDPTKSYEFVTTANRGGTYTPARMSQFSILGADSFTNASTAGVSVISAGVLHLNSGSNTANGDIIKWTGITAADGVFTIRSENVPFGGLGQPSGSHGYGLQGFSLEELATIPLPPAAWAGLSTLAGIGLIGMIRRRRQTAS